MNQELEESRGNVLIGGQKLMKSKVNHKMIEEEKQELVEESKQNDSQDQNRQINFLMNNEHLL